MQKSRFSRRVFLIIILSLILVSVFASVVLAADTFDVYLQRGSTSASSVYKIVKSSDTNAIKDLESQDYSFDSSYPTQAAASQYVSSQLRTATKVDPTFAGCEDVQKDDFLMTRYCIWLTGKTPDSPEGMGLVASTVKWLMLIIVILLTWAAFTQVGFPKNGGVKFFLAIVVGILATFLVTSGQLISLLQSYTALGVTFATFLPILVLLFFSFVVATKASPMGIYMQKVMWVIYSVYLFLKAGSLWLLTQSEFDGTNLSLPSWIDYQFVREGLYGKDPAVIQSLFQSANGGNDTITLFVLVVTAIAVFIIMVLMNNYVETWLMREREKSAIDVAREELELSRANDKLKSDDMKKRGSAA